MAFSDLEKKLIEQEVGSYCERKSPAHIRDKLGIRYHIDGQAATIVERRPMFRTPRKFTESFVARSRYTRTSGLWTLYWPDSRGRWHEYDRMRSTRDLQVLIAEVDRDPTGIFWG